LIQRQADAIGTGVARTNRADLGRCEGGVQRKKMHCASARCGTCRTVVLAGTDGQCHSITADGNTVTEMNIITLTQCQTARAGVIVANGACLGAGCKTRTKAKQMHRTGVAFVIG